MISLHEGSWNTGDAIYFIETRESITITDDLIFVFDWNMDSILKAMPNESATLVLQTQYRSVAKRGYILIHPEPPEPVSRIVESGVNSEPKPVYDRRRWVHRHPD
jgi:hypothetical protein